MISDRSGPYSTLMKRYSKQLSHYLDEKTRDIDHHDVMSDLAGRTELSGSYLSSITLANLIALLGLLTNSTAVVIGAMLISPLMGPIFSLGLAFAMGDLALSRRAVRNIGYSVLLTVAIAALFTLLSPLKGATHEILSRTNPNIYDLLIAVIAGTAGALALCTRKNYLFTTTGVAVATAVIPPLSVVGYGLGTWQPGMAMGGFLLFFTNLVAIVISSNVVFYFLRFRGSMVEEAHYTIRRRFQILGSVLVLISIPLIITLVSDLRKVKLTNQVENVLKSVLDRPQQSRLTSVAINTKDGNLVITASINTLKYVDSAITTKIESELTSRIGKPVSLNLEQVIVRSGAVDPAVSLRTVLPKATPQPVDTMATLQEKILGKVGEGCKEVESFITPYKIRSCSVSFSNITTSVGLMITVERDYLPNTQEIQWLTTVLEKKLGVIVDLKVDSVPFLPPVSFTEKDEIDAVSLKALVPLRQILLKQPATRISIEIPSRNRANEHSRIHLSKLKEYLIKQAGAPAGQITVSTSNDGLMRVRVLN